MAEAGTGIPGSGPSRIAIRPRREMPRHPPSGGWLVVARKEMADHLLSFRFSVLMILLGLAGFGSVFAVAGKIRDVAPAATEDPSLLLRLFTIPPGEGQGQEILAFISLIGFLAPLLGIAFGFDAVNGERAQGTLPRLVAQPIHRDDIVNGKFTAGLVVIGLSLAALTALVSGIGLLRLGIVPDPEEVWRILTWLLVTCAYVGFWLAFATLCSVWLRRAATSALASIAAWLMLTIFATLLFRLMAGFLAPVPDQATPDQQIRNARVERTISRISPSTLYAEATIALLQPETRSVGLILPGQFQQLVEAGLDTQLTFAQSLLLVWPQVVGLIALTVLCFAGAYILFMKQEIRA